MHFKEYYACGEHIRRQCRCPGGEKTVSHEECPLCPKDSFNEED